MSFAPAEEFRFGPFCLLPDHSVLLKDGEPVRLGSRATEILTFLVRNAGMLVTKTQIFEQVWPDTVVVEANLSVHMSALRRALDDADPASPYIVTIPGRGYRFAAGVAAERLEAPYQAEANATPNNLPLLLTRLIGRSDVLQALDRQLAEQRLVTIVGTGGVGKTALALNAAERQLGRWRDGVWIADFASLADAELVPAALATVLGLEVRSSNPVPALISALAEKEMLLLLDNCEHVIEAVAMISNAMLQSARSVTILTTSREPLTIPGENVLRLEPLSVPPETEIVGAQEALHYAAIELLSERARAIDAGFELGDEDALAASLICRKLGGVPLAIEFASALVPIFGLRGLSTRLDDRLRLLGDGHRSALPRHRTLTAALDWSYQLLEASEQRILRRLAVFTGGFTIEAATAAMASDVSEAEMAEIVARLVRKSLVSPDMRDTRLRFRLLETTRAFALVALEVALESAEASRLHAEYYARALHGDGELSPASDDYRAFVPDLDNIRAALRWATSASGDVPTALAIGAGALPIWFGLSLLTECGTHMTALMDGLDARHRQSPHGAAIDIAIQATGIFTFGAPDASYRDWTERERLAANENDLIERVRLLLGRWTYNIRMPDYDLADEQSLTMEAVARSGAATLVGDAPLAFLVDPAHLQATASWARGTTLHHIGDLSAARACLERFLGEETAAMRSFFMTITGFDRRSDVYGLLSIAKCLQGEVENGLGDAETALREARSTGKALPLCEALQWSCFTMLVMGEPVSQLGRLINELLDTSKNHSLFSHLGVALCMKGCLAAAAGRHERATELLQQGLTQLHEAHYGPFDPIFAGVLGTSLAATGQLRDAQRSIEIFEEARGTHHGFCGPELLRRKALLTALAGNPDLAEAGLRTARDEAARQGAQLWQLRAGSDLAALYQARERPEEARREREALTDAISGELRSRGARWSW